MIDAKKAAHRKRTRYSTEAMGKANAEDGEDDDDVFEWHVQ